MPPIQSTSKAKQTIRNGDAHLFSKNTAQQVGVERWRQSLSGLAELMGGAEYKNRVTIRHSMQKIEDEVPPISSAKHRTILGIAPPRASFAHFSLRERKVGRRIAAKQQTRLRAGKKSGSWRLPRNYKPTASVRREAAKLKA